MRLSACRLFVRELAPAVAFYGQVLGLPLLHGGADDGYVVFDVGAGVQWVVEPVGADAPAEDQALVGRFTGLSLAVPDIAAEHQRLVQAGVHFTGVPERQLWGGTLATLQDPAGNQLQIIEYPAASTTP